MTDAWTIRDAAEADLEPMRAIYNREVRETTATWTTVERSPRAMRRWWMNLRLDGYPSMVAEAEGEILGYAAYGRFRSWPGYWRSAENTIYVAESARGRGVGAALLAGLEARARYHGLRALVSGVGADRPASLALHLKAGYAECGRLPGVGEKFGQPLDLVLLMKTL